MERTTGLEPATYALGRRRAASYATRIAARLHRAGIGGKDPHEPIQVGAYRVRRPIAQPPLYRASTRSRTGGLRHTRAVLIPTELWRHELGAQDSNLKCPGPKPGGSTVSPTAHREPLPGLEPDACRLQGGRSGLVSYRDMVRPPGLEPGRPSRSTATSTLRVCLIPPRAH
jgi:hypothetical protein